VESLTKSLFKSKIYPYFAFPLREKFSKTEIDLSSGWKAKESNMEDWREHCGGRGRNSVIGNYVMEDRL